MTMRSHGMRPVDLFAGDDVQRVADAFGTVVELGEAKVEAQFTTKDGRGIPYEFTGSLLKDQDENPYAIAGIGRDISERKRAEAERERLFGELGERVKELDCVYGLSRLIERPGITLDEILQGTVELIPPSWHYPDITCARVVLDEREYKTENFRKTGWKQSADVVIRGVKKGAIEVYVTEEMPQAYEGPFSKEERQLLNTLAERLCRVVERIEAQEELWLKESAISTSINGIAIANMEGRLTYVNRAFLDLHGYESPDEVLGREIVEFVKDERELVPVMSELLEKGSWVGEVESRKKDCSLFDGQFTTSVIVDDRGKPVALLATMLDITERKRAEKGLEESESRFRLLTEKMGDLLWTTDLEMNATYVSPSVEAILGFTPDEYSKLPIQEKVTPESIQSSGEILADELQHDKERDPGRSYIIDLNCYHKDGSVRNMETSLSLIRDDNGDPVGVYGLARMLPSAKAAEEALEEEREEVPPALRQRRRGHILIRLRVDTDGHKPRRLRGNRLQQGRDTW